MGGAPAGNWAQKTLGTHTGLGSADKRMKPHQTIRQTLSARRLPEFLLRLALSVAVIIAIALWLTALPAGDDDDIGLYNPIYMLLNFGKMTYPVHGFPQGMFVHPPTHYTEVAAFLWLGFDLRVAAVASIVLALVLLLVLISSARRLTDAEVALILVASLVAVALPFSYLFPSVGISLRPEASALVLFLCGVACLERATHDGSKIWSFLGAATVIYASTLHYVFWIGAFGVGIYLSYWLFLSVRYHDAIPEARRHAAMLVLGALTVGVPFILTFIIPHSNGIVEFVIPTGKIATQGNGPEVHAAIYRAHPIAFQPSARGLRFLGERAYRCWLCAWRSSISFQRTCFDFTVGNTRRIRDPTDHRVHLLCSEKMGLLS